MSDEQDFQLMQALTEARSLIGRLKFEAVDNGYAWEKLANVWTYLGKEQTALGRKMFADPEGQSVIREPAF